MSHDVLGIILVHGWLGSPTDLTPLVERLARYGTVENLRLPCHGTQPTYAEAEFLTTIAAAIDRQNGRRLILIGHSTGGSLLLAELARRMAEAPSSPSNLLLMVLCATPPRIDLSYTQRWATHTESRVLELHDLGSLVGLVNRLARRTPLELSVPVLIIQGEDDELVTSVDADLWWGRFTGAQRHVRIAGAKHHLFTGEGAEVAIDAISRAIDDATRRDTNHGVLFNLAPGLEAFCKSWPDSQRHIENSPAGMRAVGRAFDPTTVAEYQPTLANIEITTRCTLGCSACARTQLKLQSRFMSRETFQHVLEALPHAWRINLVGLGEPLLHPELLDFIELAVAAKRRVSLVSNAMQLDADMARALCASGLSGITFSIDAVDQAVAARVRLGSDMAIIGANITNFIEEKKRQCAKLGTAVFTALTGETLNEFEAIVDFVADRELDALMVTDLNFPSNQSRSVHAAFTPEHARLFRRALKRAVARRLPVLSVWGLEEIALNERYLDYLILRGEQLAHRSERHSHCVSPWQTIPVGVEGNLSICDCQPGEVLGNILHTPLSEWWNGPVMREQRRKMLSENPPKACLVCPRF
jgi:MoaA/NifB/PqqE/SkfB family radical SAM enzyme/pimeloyl-ACP methyl ester carboxylesterase